ncbi:MAG: flagellar biosynthetic protein FliR [Nitrospinae bacterium]|nr:flagellar biosynthetic protein FliR [Nitrospinota bacterium]
MSIFNFSQYEIETLMLVFTRIGGIIGVAPILGSNSSPALLKVGFIAALTILVYPTLKIPMVEYPQTLAGLSLALGAELLIGILISFVARLVFTGIELAGTIIGYQMGFGIVNVIDPLTASSVSITSTIYNVFSMLIFLIMDCHHYFIDAILGSFELIPPLGLHYSGTIVESFTILFESIFLVGIKLSAPIVAALFFSNVALGLVARTVPQMNVFIVGFPLQIGLGLFIIGITIPLFSIYVKTLFTQMGRDIVGLMRIM